MFAHLIRPGVLVGTALSILTFGCADDRRPFAPMGGSPSVSADGADTRPAGPFARGGRSDEIRAVALPADPQLADYLACAALNSPELASAYAAAQAARHRAAAAGVPPDPKISYAAYIREVETRVGPQRHRLGVAQTIPYPPKLSDQRAAAGADADAAFARYHGRKLAIFARVAKAYAEYYYLGRALAAAEENLRLLEHFETVARQAYVAAGVPQTQVLRLEVERGRLSDRVQTLRARRTPAAAALRAAVGLTDQRPLPLPQAIPPGPGEVDDPRLIAWAESANPELRALAAEVEAAEHRVSHATRQYIPDATVGLTWIQTGRAVGASPPFDNGKDPLIASVSIHVPIWWNRIRADIRAARQKRQELGQRRQQHRADLSAAVQDAAFALRDAGRRVQLYTDLLVPRAQKAVQITLQSYSAREAGFSDLIDAERVLLEFRLSAERARADRLIAAAELERLIGRPLLAAGPSPATRPAGGEDGDPVEPAAASSR